MRNSLIIITALFSWSWVCQAQTYLRIEGAAVWQSQNDQRIPGNAGDNFSFADFSQGPFPAYRIYLGHKWNNRHEIRALYAPLAISLNGQFGGDVRFQDAVFAANTPTEGYYKFNSYRLTYAYHFDPINEWELAAGFTGKIRDASVELKQGALNRSKDNVGFVPLLNFQAARRMASQFFFRFDLDALAAPQGRAVDAGMFVEYRTDQEHMHYFLGYRMVEGGADNDQVFNFAWFHFATIGAQINF